MNNNLDYNNLTKILKRATEEPLIFTEYVVNLPFDLSINQKIVLDTFYDPAFDFTELVLACGRKSFKTGLAAVVTLFEVMKLLQIPDPQKYYGLIPGQNIYIMNVATNREQARDVTLQYIKALANNSWYLNEYIVNETAEELQFANNIIARCQSSSSRAGRGYACIVNIYDELAWYMERGNMSGDAVYSALQPNLKPFKGEGKTIAISSPAGKSGIFWEIFRYGKPIKVIQNTLEHGQHPWRAVFQLPTWEMNPTLPFKGLDMQRALKLNPDKFLMEYGAEFCAVVDAALNSRKVVSCAKGKMISPQAEDLKTPRVITLDPATVGHAYALAMGHKAKDNKVIVDLIMRWEGTRENPINIPGVELEVERLFKRFNITDIGIDQYQSASTIQRLKEKGLPIRLTRFTTQYNAEIYECLINKINTETIEYPKHQTLLNQLIYLQKKISGRIVRYEAAAGHQDDLSDVIANLSFIIETQSPTEMWATA